MNLTQFAEWLIEAYHSDDGMPEAKEICREARAALSAQPVAGAVAHTSERHFALREAHCIAASEAFWKARPGTEDTGRRIAFDAGFVRGFDAGEKVYAAPQPQAAPAPEPVCQPNGLMFDALGEPRTRYVRVSLHGSHCVMHPSEGDTYLKDARENGDESPYVAADVWLSEREFDNLGEFDGF